MLLSSGAHRTSLVRYFIDCLRYFRISAGPSLRSRGGRVIAELLALILLG
jgi:hypothetical protein